MSVVSMQKITLVAHKRDRRKILRVLAKLGTLETAKAKEYECTATCTDTSQYEEIDRKIAKLNFAFSFLKDINKEQIKAEKALPKEARKSKLITIKKENKVISYDELADVVKEEYDLFSHISTMEKINSALVDIKSETARIKNLYQQISDYSELDIKFSQIKDTKRVTMAVGLVANEKLAALQSTLPQGTDCSTATNDKNTLVAILATIDDKEALQKCLSAVDFCRCPYDYNNTPLEMLRELSAKLDELKAARENAYSNATECITALGSLKLIYDYYLIERAKMDVVRNCQETSKAFIMEGWVPESLSQMTADAIKEACPSVEYVISEPEEQDSVPTLMKNSALVTPFGDSITAMYGYPKYKGLDPNPAVAFFYFLFFGFMLSDAGYGILMTVGCFAYLLIKKPVKNSGSFIKMFGLCGISTIIWGAIFGGWFGIEGSVLEGSAFGRFLLSLRLVDPLDGSQTLIMFGMALGLGVIQIAVGFLLNGISKLKKAPLDGIFNDFSWVAIFVGAGIYLLDIILKTKVVTYIGIGVVLLGLLMLIIGGCIGKKNPLLMITGAFKNLYGSVNVFSDILSYARLFGLGLTTCVIGLVVNKMGMIFVDMIPYGIGYIPAIVVWVGGHIFNLAINTLGVYVHNSRLQYVEFFGKFYEGGGHAFNPLGSKTKYIYLSDSLSVKASTKQK